ncbi:MAG: methyl-accepting chemotaxis protein [Candidatus Obscuribacterales bacterium]|jgi:methyl-accepting chemotaxis protein
MPNDSLESQLSSQLLVSSLCFGAITLFIGWQWWSSEQAIAVLQSTAASSDHKETIEAVQALKHSNMFLGIAYLLALAVASVTTAQVKRFMERSVVQPLKALTDAAQKIGQGDLKYEIPKSAQNDELGALSDTFEKMVSSLRSDTQHIAEAVQVLASSVKQIVVSTSESSISSTNTAATVTQTTVSAEEVRQTTLVATQKGRYVADLAQQAAQISMAGKAAADDTVEQMNEIREQMKSIAQNMAGLTEKGQAIAEITASVDELSQQSNLLAVNASIEAARAGELGKGFAVVAQEVKALSNQSKQATAEVRKILNDIQQAAQHAAVSIEQGTRTVESAVKQSTEAGRSIESLANSVSEAASAAVQIAAASQEQLTGIDQVVTAMQGIQDATKQHVASSKQIEQAAFSLTAIQDVLEGLVAKYKK